jgi:uncharacterized membrane protein YccC
MAALLTVVALGYHLDLPDWFCSLLFIAFVCCGTVSVVHIFKWLVAFSRSDDV